MSCFVEFMTPDEPPANHHEFLVDFLEAIERRDIMRGTVSMPPGHAKTKYCSRYFPAWYLGRNPNHRYLQGGHSQDFAENEFGKYVRDIIEDPKYAQVFPEVRLHPRSTAAGNWRLANFRGGYVAKGVGQSISGYRGHCGGIDDPFGKREDAQSETIRNRVGSWFFADFRTRFLPNSPIFIVATRWHPDDLIGRVETLNREGRGIPWVIINLNGLIETEEEAEADPLGRSIGEALWPDYYSAEILLELKATLPSTDWWALYKGKPSDEQGNIVRTSWFQRYDELPRNDVDAHGNVINRRVRRITLSVDCAEKETRRADPSALTVWVEDFQHRHYLADVVCKRVELPELITLIEETARKWNVGAILVEEGGAGVQYIQLRQGKAPAPIIPMPTGNKSKEFRFDAVAPMFEAGEVFLPKAAPWLADYEQELLAFPNGTRDDRVDSTSQYLKWARQGRTYGSRKLKGLAHAA